MGWFKKFKKKLKKISIKKITKNISLKRALPVVGALAQVVPGVGTIAGGAILATSGAISKLDKAKKIYKSVSSDGGNKSSVDKPQVIESPIESGGTKKQSPMLGIAKSIGVAYVVKKLTGL